MHDFIGIGNMSNLSVWIQGGMDDPDTDSHDMDITNTALEWCRDIIIGILLVVLSLVTFIGNAMVLHAVRTERRLQSVNIIYGILSGEKSVNRRRNVNYKPNLNLRQFTHITCLHVYVTQCISPFVYQHNAPSIQWSGKIQWCGTC